MQHVSTELSMIMQFYGDRKAERSGVPLINHIHEGITILQSLAVSLDTINAFCLHPMLQSDDELAANMRYVANYANPMAILLAMEYRRAANAYLCVPATDHYTLDDLKSFVGPLIPEVRDMLWADKRQNSKDFRLYHYGTHARSRELSNYFSQWLRYIGRGDFCN